MSWIVETPVDAIVDGKHYFLALRHDGTGTAHYEFWSRYLSGRTTWSVKPGIAIQYEGCQELRDTIRKQTAPVVAVEVPTDYATRWKARKHRFNTKP